MKASACHEDARPHGDLTRIAYSAKAKEKASPITCSREMTHFDIGQKDQMLEIRTMRRY